MAEASNETKIAVSNLDLHYGAFHALHGITMDMPRNQITAFIGPSGCGKSTFLRCLNRMNDAIEGCRVEGSIRLDGEELYSKEIDVNLLRKRVGMVFQKANPFPMSVYDNVAFGPRTHGVKGKAELDEIVETVKRLAPSFGGINLEDIRIRNSAFRRLAFPDAWPPFLAYSLTSLSLRLSKGTKFSLFANHLTFLCSVVIFEYTKRHPALPDVFLRKM